MLRFGKRRRRAWLRAQPVPDAWRAIVEANVPIFRRLPPADQAELLEHVQVLLAEKHFEGCGGLVLTDEVRVTIAAQASVLLLRRSTDYFSELRTVLVYPSGYVAPTWRYLTETVREEWDEARLGHADPREGVIVLAWDAARGASSADDGDHNIVWHEFAHQLDFEDGNVDGIPLLATREAYAVWARALGAEHARLCEAQDRGEPTVLHPYGATNPVEFFAVATECFFARPVALRAGHPRLYAQLRGYFRQDPARDAPETLEAAEVADAATSPELDSSEEARAPRPPIHYTSPDEDDADGMTARDWIRVVGVVTMFLGYVFSPLGFSANPKWEVAFETLRGLGVFRNVAITLFCTGAVLVLVSFLPPPGPRWRRVLRRAAATMKRRVARSRRSR